MIQWIYEQGCASLVYYGFHVLGFIAVFLFNIWYGKKHCLSPKRSALTTLVVYPVVYIWIYILCWAETGFKNFGGNNIVRGFVYIPLIAWPVGKLLKIEWKRLCDFIAPCVCLCHGISHIGCIFPGCCAGYPCSWGIYRAVSLTTVFPVQLFEAATALVIFGFIVYRAARRQYRIDGLSYPIMLILFGSTRFLWEFARNNDKIWLGCSSLAFHALFMSVVGLDIFFTVWEKNKQKQLKEEKLHHIKRRKKK